MNAIYSGEFVTKARESFSNSFNSKMQKWHWFVSGTPKRQDYLHTALDWVSRGKISEYMSLHRHDTEISELETYFDSVIDWAGSIFGGGNPDTQKIDWGRLYETYHKNSYNPTEIRKRLDELYEDFYVKNKVGIYEYLLDGEQDKTLLNVRIFDEPTKKSVYAKQTNMAQQKGESNCPLCALGDTPNKNKIWKIGEMDADHVTAWSKGGSTDIKNCQMLCKTHNRAKGNR